jgi:N-methylhydantoinase A
VVADLVEAFGEEHRRTYGHRADDETVDLVNLRVIGWAEPSGPKTIDPAAAISGHGHVAARRPDKRMAHFGATHGRLETPVIARKDLAGRRWDGPLIVEEYDATTVVPPGWTAALDEWGSVVMTCG